VIVAAGTWRKDVQARDWVGKAVAEALGLDLDKATDRERVKTLLACWIKTGALKTVTRKDANREDKVYVEVGQAAAPPPPPPPPPS
jgi:hypothetical protein